MHRHEWVRVGQIKSMNAASPTANNDSYCVPLKNRIRAISRPSNEQHPSAKEPIPISHGASLASYSFGYFSPSNDAHTVHIQRKRPIRVSQMKRQICAWPKIPSRVKTHDTREEQN